MVQPEPEIDEFNGENGKKLGTRDSGRGLSWSGLIFNNETTAAQRLQSPA
jgi:hypothetical protein